MAARTVSIWSSDAHDALAALAVASGWTIVADRGAIALIDLRGGDEAPSAAWPPGWAIGLVADADPCRQDAAIAAGARQIAVVGPAGEGLAQALALAAAAIAPAERRAMTIEPQSRPLVAWVDEAIVAGQPVALVGVTLRRLDLVNAAHGRTIGTALVDAAERRIAAQVSAVAEDDGIVVRVNGPTFLAAIAGDADRAVTAAARIEEALARPFRGDGVDRVLGAAIDLTLVRGGESGEAAIGRAVAAAAAHGNAGVVDPLAVAVHHAFAGDAIAILFQPQVQADGAIVGVEALARWRHDGAELGAEALLGAAERAGIGTALSDGIVRAMLARVAAWPAALGGLRVSFNLTAADLSRPSFVETLLGRIDASGVERRRLTLEVTETGLIDDLEAAAAVLAGFQAAGLAVAIDDFGAGYSNLSYLAAVPVEELKVDRSLVAGAAEADRSAVVVHAAIAMARSLGLTVIAEGVETAAQRDALAAAGCGLFQGFLYAPPVTEAVLLTLIERQRAL